MSCRRVILDASDICRVEQCDCGSVHVSLGALTVRLEPEELACVAGEWEVRLFTDVRFGYFVKRGLWHVQLWHPRARVSVLTPSRLTLGAYELHAANRPKRRVASARAEDAS